MSLKQAIQNFTAAEASYKLVVDLPEEIKPALDKKRLILRGLPKKAAEELSKALSSALGVSARHTMELKSPVD